MKIKQFVLSTMYTHQILLVYVLCTIKKPNSDCSVLYNSDFAHKCTLYNLDSVHVCTLYNLDSTHVCTLYNPDSDRVCTLYITMYSDHSSMWT